MINKHWKKIIAIFTAAIIMFAGVPGLSGVALADTEDGTGAAAGTEGTAGAPEGGDNAGMENDQTQKVDENGEVVMDGSLPPLKESEKVKKKDYELVTENSYYKMYLYKERLSILLEDKKTGKIIESTLSDDKDDRKSNEAWNAYMKSGIVLTAIKGIRNNFQVDMIMTKHSVDVTKLDNGFSAKVTFPEYGFTLTVNVTLEDKNLVVLVPDDSIVEEMEGTYIATVTLFPFMGYTYMDEEEGYMLIPDGNGALIYMDNKEGRYPTGFNQMIYGSDVGFVESGEKEYLWDKLDMRNEANKILAPIFGMAHTKQQTGYLAVVEKGEKRASIVAEPNGTTLNYNRCYARFLLRDVYVQPLNNSNSGTTQKAEDDRTHSDLQIRYMLLSENEADYSTMAAKYRQYLLDNGVISVKDNSYKTRVDFLGTEREDFLLSTRAVTMTDVDNIENIYNELQSAGVASLLSVFKGWQKGGLYDLPNASYNVDGHVGGKSGLTKLIKNAAEKNYKMYLYADALRLNPSIYKLNFDMIKRINKRTYEEEIFKAEVYDTFYFLVPGTSMENFQSLVEDAVSDEVSGIAAAGVTNNIFSYSYKGDFYTRNDAANAYAKTMGEMAGKSDLILEEPFMYLWSDANAFLDMPLGSSDYMYIDEEIPFLSMVLKGIVPMYSDYVNFEANKQEFFLQMIEAGVYPSFYITQEDSSNLILTNSADLYSTAYSTYKDMIIDYDKQFREFSLIVEGANITKHERLENGITKVTYSNGAIIYINYTDSAQTVDGITVDAMSYSHKAGEAE